MDDRCTNVRPLSRQLSQGRHPANRDTSGKDDLMQLEPTAHPASMAGVSTTPHGVTPATAGHPHDNADDRGSRHTSSGHDRSQGEGA